MPEPRRRPAATARHFCPCPSGSANQPRPRDTSGHARATPPTSRGHATLLAIPEGLRRPASDRRPIAAPVSSDIQAVERVARILELFDHRTVELSAAEAAVRLGLKRTTVQRYFSSMLGVGLLERGSATGSYSPGPVLAQLGALAVGRRRVIDRALPYMRDLSARTHLTSVLSLWGTAGPVVMHVEEDPAASGVVSVRVGSRLSILSAQAVVFLAFLGDERRIEAALESLSTRARAHARMLIKSARVSGVATYISEDTGVGAVAAPVFDTAGICATLALLGTLVTTSNDMRRDEQVAAAAEAITREMGGKRALESAAQTG
jgi:DNA-binding IclR family transcriptional regulator